jgi:hypothetical protein
MYIAAAVAVRAVWRCYRWRWVELRTSRALATGNSALLSYLLTHRCERVARAALCCVASAAADASATRVAHTAACMNSFPSVSESALSKGSAAALRASSSAAAVPLADRGMPQPVLSSGALSLRVSSGSDVSDSSSALSARSGGSRSNSETGSLEIQSFVNAAKMATHISNSGCSAVSSDTPEGRVVHLLTTDPTIATAVLSSVRRLLGSADYAAQRDAAEAVQILSFSGDGVAQMLVNEGEMLPLRSVQTYHTIERFSAAGIAMELSWNCHSIANVQLAHNWTYTSASCVERCLC